MAARTERVCSIIDHRFDNYLQRIPPCIGLAKTIHKLCIYIHTVYIGLARTIHKPHIYIYSIYTVYIRGIFGRETTK